MSDRDRPRTVFGAPDQDEIIARLDAVESDDEGTSIFDAQAQESSAAREAFAAGISTFGGVPQVPQPDPRPDAPTQGSGEEGTDSRRVAPPVGPPRADREVTLPLEDPALRAAFILGGPAALRPDPA